MWVCPKCGRSFARTRQDHYCGCAPTTIDAYVALQSEAQKPQLEKLLQLIRSLYPDATESIKWSMPCFQYNAATIQLAACKNWISIYIGADVIAKFCKNQCDLDYKKDALYLPYDRELPWDILSHMIAAVFGNSKHQS